MKSGQTYIVVSNKERVPEHHAQLFLAVHRPPYLFMTKGTFTNDMWYTAEGVFEQDDPDIEILWLDKGEIDMADDFKEIDRAIESINRITEEIINHSKK